MKKLCNRIFHFSTKKPFWLTGILAMTTMMSLAQITITTNDMPSTGDTIRKSTALNPSGTDYTLTGAGYSWDFTELLTISQTVDTFVSVSSVPLWYQIVFIPNFIANLAQKYPEIDTIPEFQVVDPYRFFKNSSSSFNDVGFAFTINEIPIPLKYNTPDVLYKFPMNYGNVDSSFSGIEFSIPDIGYIGIDRKRVNHVDGWGTLTTPYGTHNVLRLKSTVTENDTIYIDSIQFGTSINRLYTEYKWLGSGFGEPLLQVYEEGPLATYTFIDSIRDPLLVVNPAFPYETEFVVIPNPLQSSGSVYFAQPSAGKVKISVLHVTGTEAAIVYDGFLPEGEHRITLDQSIQKLHKGLYILQLQNEFRVLTQKMIIQ